MIRVAQTESRSAARGGGTDWQLEAGLGSVPVQASRGPRSRVTEETGATAPAARRTRAVGPDSWAGVSAQAAAWQACDSRLPGTTLTV